jgi:hypothetical protein
MREPIINCHVLQRRLIKENGPFRVDALSGFFMPERLASGLPCIFTPKHKRGKQFLQHHGFISVLSVKNGNT